LYSRIAHLLAAAPLELKSIAENIDLAFLRSDKIISVCEIKYHDKPIGADIIADMELKIRKLKAPRGYGIEKILIAPHGVDKKTKVSGYFHQILTLEDLI
jgi:hypothetical protein